VETTYFPLWHAYRGDGFRGLSTWLPFRRLVRRVRRHCAHKGIVLTPFRPVASQIADGCAFPDYFATAVRNPNLYVTIVCDPDVEEPVIYAYGPAIDEE
jgi:hypothetical protein